MLRIRIVAPRLREKSKRTIYLDQSTLCDAFRSCMQPPSAVAEYRPLMPWIERVAHEANLCLSTAHIIEIAGIPQKHLVQAEGIAAWVDALPTVWVRSVNEVVPEEADYWTKRAAGIVPSGEPENFTDDIADAYSTMDPAARRTAAATPGSIYPFLDAAREYGFEDARDRMREVAEAIRTVYEQRRALGIVFTDARQRQERRTAIRTLALEAIERVNARNDADLGGQQLPRTTMDLLVDLWEKDPTVLPSWRIRLAHTTYLAERYGKISSDKKLRAETRSDWVDYQHVAVAAAHCAVFTCDGRVAASIREARVGLGLSPPLTAKNHPGGIAGFVAALMSMWP